MTTSFTGKAGNSQGAIKGWLHRHRPASLVGKTRTQKLGNLANRSAQVLGGLYLKKYGKRLKRRSLMNVLKGRYAAGVGGNVAGNTLLKHGDSLVSKGWSGKALNTKKLKGFAAMVAKKKAEGTPVKSIAKKELSLEMRASLIRDGLRLALEAACPSKDASGNYISSCWLQDTFDDYVILYADGKNWMSDWGKNEDGTYWLEDKADWDEVVRSWEVKNSTGSKELTVTYKVGNSAGVKKGWAHRLRRHPGKVGSAISKAVVKFGGFAKAKNKKPSLSQIGSDIKKAVTPTHKKPSFGKIGSDIKKAISPKHKKASLKKIAGDVGKVIKSKHKKYGKKEVEVTEKAGTSAGVKKGWAHRARAAHGALSNANGGLIPGLYRGGRTIAKSVVPGAVKHWARGAGILGKTGLHVAKGVGKHYKRGGSIVARTTLGLGKGAGRLAYGTTRRALFGTKESMVTSFKDDEGGDHFLLVAGGAYQDGDKQWITKNAYDNWIATLKENEDGYLERENGEEVVYRWWHVGEPDKETGSRGDGVDLGKIRHIERMGNFIVAMGDYDTKEIADAFAPYSDDLGASLGYFHPASQPKTTGGEFRDIDGFEISALPKHRASFPFTLTLNQGD